jgi:hypothetical protein
VHRDLLLGILPPLHLSGVQVLIHRAALVLTTVVHCVTHSLDSRLFLDAADSDGEQTGNVMY